MSFFGDKLNELMTGNRMTSPVLARVAEISEGQISKLRNGLQTWVSAEQFEKLAHALSDREEIHAELLQAYLLDHCRGPGSEMITVSISGRRGAAAQSPPAGLARLPLDLQNAFETLIKESEFDKDLRDVVYGMANLVVPERALQFNDASSDPRLAEVEAEAARIAEAYYGKPAKSKRAPKKPSR